MDPRWASPSNTTLLYLKPLATMEVAGLVISIVPLWESCVQVFEVINFARQYGMDYEILSIKLEVERVRLLSWGHAVGLDDPSSTDTRLTKTEVHSAVERLLGCIRHVFVDSERPQNTYGLRPSLVAPEREFTTADDNQPSQSQLILRGVFKRAYENLRRVARERQHNTPLIRKSKWAVNDRKKFMALVAEVRGFNDSLESLFPDVKLRMRAEMQSDIDEAVEIRDLQLLQEATAGEQGLEEISERASVRLEVLGATVSARTELLSDSQSISAATEDKDQDEGEEDADQRETVKDEGEEASSNDQAVNEGESTRVVEQELDELSKRLRDIELYVQKKSAGALTLSRIGPSHRIAHCSAHVYWDGDKSKENGWDYWSDKNKGFVPSLHACFG
jgi:hypothetical protein